MWYKILNITVHSEGMSILFNFSRRTGDIGQLVLATGSIKIIDRRKDLVKLQMGEYVSLSKVSLVFITDTSYLKTYIKIVALIE